ncbi:MAG TPA: cytochrome o ubiquinol oxidase subunit IV [Candidatus Saccharimonadales bacterium]|nr:cytochrome o ubiquinol oxidase subunit IV [Candidatus Saccharimonadales bacterium]
MSNTSEDNQHNTPHGTLASYVVGFVLSLIFTLIPYYLVVNKTVHGTALLATIIGFAVVQLVIQVVFFLHIGREKKPRFNLLFLLATIGLIVVVVVGSIVIIHNLQYNMVGVEVTNKITEGEAVHTINNMQAGSCPADTGKNYKLELKDGTILPSRITAGLCDTITIVNLEDSTHTLGFERKDEPVRYAGQADVSVRSQRSEPIRLTDPGAYRIYDTEHSERSADFTVADY